MPTFKDLPPDARIRLNEYIVETEKALQQLSTGDIQIPRNTDGWLLKHAKLDGSVPMGLYVENHPTPDLQLLTRGTPRITITHDGGNVGIGTTSPTEALEVAGSMKASTTANSATTLSLGSNRSGAGQGIALIEARWDGNLVAEVGFRSGADTTNKDDGTLTFRTAESGVMSERMVIKADGTLNISNVQVGSAGLSSGDVYKDASGFLMIV